MMLPERLLTNVPNYWACLIPADPMWIDWQQREIRSGFTFNKPRLEGYDYSFSGLKTSFLYFLRDQPEERILISLKQTEGDLAASLQKTIIDILMKKLQQGSPAKQGSGRSHWPEGWPQIRLTECIAK